MILTRTSPPNPTYSVGAQRINARQFRKFLAYAIQNQIEPVETKLHTVWDLGEMSKTDLINCQKETV
jgi:hypothetical protein